MLNPVLISLIGDVALALLKEGADFTLKNTEDVLALDLAPDKEVYIYICTFSISTQKSHNLLTPHSQVRRYIVQGAEREGIDLGP
jgi:26S proteasome non-ATPase regulatory subunit 10